MEEYLPLIIQLVSGGLGGITAGKLFDKASLGTAGNAISGILGGGLGGYLIGMLGLGAGASNGVDTTEAVNAAADVTAGGMDLSTILGSVAGGGVGGGIVMAIVGTLKNILSKK